MTAKICDTATVAAAVSLWFVSGVGYADRPDGGATGGTVVPNPRPDTSAGFRPDGGTGGGTGSGTVTPPVANKMPTKLSGTLSPAPGRTEKGTVTFTPTRTKAGIEWTMTLEVTGAKPGTNYLLMVGAGDLSVNVKQDAKGVIKTKVKVKFLNPPEQLSYSLSASLLERLATENRTAASGTLK